MKMTPRRAAPSFSPTDLQRLRDYTVEQAIELLGLYAKEDLEYKPASSDGPQTKRLHISREGMVYEMLVTGVKWYDSRFKQGGGGAIDFAMYVFNESFRAAASRLLRAEKAAASTVHDEAQVN